MVSRGATERRGWGCGDAMDVMGSRWKREMAREAESTADTSRDAEPRAARARVLSAGLRRDPAGGVSLVWASELMESWRDQMTTSTRRLTRRGEIAVLGEGTTHLVRYDYVERWIALGWAEVL